RGGGEREMKKPAENHPRASGAGPHGRPVPGRPAPAPGAGPLPAGGAGWPGIGAFLNWNPSTFLGTNAFASTPGRFVSTLVNFHSSVSPLGLSRYTEAGMYAVY